MDVAKSLVRCVARAFYDVKHILVVDALMIHSALRDDDLAHLLGTQTKELHKLCGKLKEDRMVNVYAHAQAFVLVVEAHTRQELKEGQTRTVARTYYYVDFRGTVDAIKYRMHKLERTVQSKMDTDAEAKGYACPRCRRRFTPLDVLPLINQETGMFDCDNCGTQLVDDDDSAEIIENQKRLGRLMQQMDKIIRMLRQIDELVVPANDFNDAIAVAVPVNRERSHASALSVPTITTTVQTQSGPAMEVKLTADDEKTAAELAAERDKKAAQAEKNAIPVWYGKSTVSGELTTVGAKEAEARAARQIDFKTDLAAAEKKSTDGRESVQKSAIEQYYALLAARTKKAEEEEEEEEEDDDEDEDDAEFEEVPMGLSNAGTGPPSTASASKPSTPKPSQSLAPMSNGMSKGSGGSSAKRSGDHLEEDSPGKKVKIQPQEGDDSEEEAEFEDI
ncbi:Transcription initiation factor [Drechslerella dactyloides]|uniref:Transcription initiation factor n=1 Tax=Drechslerella dactyloides TaxID=74499 RepID=A0AAD6NND2_DREDA|nr:Transcription initiation factor [Drechslerella dactyloides]